MKKKLIAAVTLGLIALSIFVFSITNTGSKAFGAAITVINGSDTLSASRTTINNNFAALNAALQPAPVSTSSSETANQIPFWTSTNGSPALLSGGSANFTWNGTKFTVTNASTTLLSAGNGTITAPSIQVGGGGSAGLYLNGAGTLGISNGTNAFSWNGTALYPNTNSAYDLGILSTNNWNHAYLNFATTTSISSSGSAYFATGTGLVGIGTSTPNWLLNIASSTGPQLGLATGAGTSEWVFRANNDNSLSIATTTTAGNATSTIDAAHFTNGGQLSLNEGRIATSTVDVVDWNTTPNQVIIRTGTAGFSVGFNNASTSGMTKRIVVCNPGSSAGTLTWTAPIEWVGGAAPTQTTNANQCDAYSFLITIATSTLKIFGAGSTGFN